MSPNGVSTEAVDPHQPAETPAYIRFPQLTRLAWFRVLKLAHHHSEVTEPEVRLARFLTYQRIGSRSGRIVGRRGTITLDGGMALAERYSCVHGLAPDAFWRDLRALRRRGYAEQLVRPCPGRTAVYALCLRLDAIPGDLPEDLTRALRLDRPPAPDRDDEGAYCGWMATSGHAPPAERVTVDLAPQAAAELAAAPRYAHPASSPAALAAAAITRSAQAVPAEDRPRDLRCLAVAPPSSAPAEERHAGRSKTSPLYAKPLQDPSGFDHVSRDLRWSKMVRTTQTTPPPGAAAGKRAAQLPGGDDPRAVAEGILKAVWATWRRQLGFGRVILRSGGWNAAGGWQGASAWSDLVRTIAIALPRSSAGEVTELLTGSMASAEDVGRVAAARLWKLINSRDKHHYRPRPTVSQAAHVTAWDEATPEDRARARATAPQPAVAEVRAWQRAEREQRQAEAEAQRARLYARWGIDPRPFREPERPTAPEQDNSTPRSAAESHRAALARARAEKRARRGR